MIHKTLLYVYSRKIRLFHVTLLLHIVTLLLHVVKFPSKKAATKPTPPCGKRDRVVVPITRF